MDRGKHFIAIVQVRHTSVLYKKTNSTSSLVLRNSAGAKGDKSKHLLVAYYVPGTLWAHTVSFNPHISFKKHFTFTEKETRAGKG